MSTIGSTSGLTPQTPPIDIGAGDGTLAQVAAGTATIGSGDRGDHVKTLQQQLIAAGYEMPRWGADGSFGGEAESAVRAFQGDVGLPVTGSIDSGTLHALQATGAGLSAKGPFIESAQLRDVALGAETLGSGSRGDAAKLVQQALARLGHDIGSAGADGWIGQASIDGLKAFQAGAGIAESGIVDSQTLVALDAALAEVGGVGATEGAGAVTGTSGAGQVTRTGPVTDDEITERIAAVREAYSGPYTVPGFDEPVAAPAAFRMNGGMNQKTPEEATRAMGAAIREGGQWPRTSRESNELSQAILHSAYGRGTPEEVKLITQKLIDAGKLDAYMPEPKDPQLAIRRMAWDFGVGTDCNGTVRAAYKDLYGHQPNNSSWGAGLYCKPPEFKTVDPVGAKPGDIIKLADVNGDVGHNVMVESARYGIDPSSVHASPPPSGPLTAVTVTSSWGAGGDPDYEKGGVRSETWVYDQAGDKWGTLKGDSVHWSSTDGPYEHDFTGVYRSREVPKR